MAQAELVRVEQLNALDLFTGDAMDPLVAQIKGIVDKHVPDTSTAKGRSDIASLARRVASSKVVLDNLGKELVADWKAKAKKVDVVRKQMRDQLDDLRDHARQPLTDWEQAEADRLKAEEAARRYDAEWEEAHQMHDLFERERVVREKEAEIARQEAERRAKEEAERLERERKEREERIAREAAEKAKREAEESIVREKAKAEQAERDRIAAEARAKAEQEAAVREAERKAQEEAERKERERLAAEKAEKDRLARLAANKEHRARIEAEAMEDMAAEGLAEPDAQLFLELVRDKAIRHITINYS